MVCRLIRRLFEYRNDEYPYDVGDLDTYDPYSPENFKNLIFTDEANEEAIFYSTSVWIIYQKNKFGPKGKMHQGRFWTILFRNA